MRLLLIFLLFKGKKWIGNIRGYYDRGRNCRQFSLLTWTSYIGQFIHPELVEDMGLRGWMGVSVSLFWPSEGFTFI